LTYEFSALNNDKYCRYQIYRVIEFLLLAVKSLEGLANAVYNDSISELSISNIATFSKVVQFFFFLVMVLAVVAAILAYKSG
jgi:hypothetical protein